MSTDTQEPTADLPPAEPTTESDATAEEIQAFLNQAADAQPTRLQRLERGLRGPESGRAVEALLVAAVERREAQLALDAHINRCRACRSHLAAGSDTAHGEHNADYCALRRALGLASDALDRACDAVLAIESQ
jgi:hypothetical protein